MSIAPSIKALTEAGKLCKFPLQSRQLPKRRLFLTETALKDLQSPNSATNILGVRGFIESAMTRWVLGQRVFADDKGKPRFLKRLDSPPPEIWEIRVIEPRVQARLFGRFAEPDTLILTRFHSRGVLRDRKKSAAHDSEWQVAMKECEASWNKLFPGEAPFSGPNIHAYVTENCDDFTI
ncbi:MAG: hypothetical protein ABSG88_16380 [Bradyrhizobium sp.]